MYMNLKVILFGERSQMWKVFTESFININFKNRQNEVIVEIKTLVSYGRVGIVWKHTWMNLRHQNGSGFYASFLIHQIWNFCVKSIC